MPLRARRLLLALRYLGYLLTLSDDHLAKLALEESFAFSRDGLSLGLQTEAERAADRLIAAELQAMSRLDLWNCRGHAALIDMREDFLRRLEGLGVRREPPRDDCWEMRLIWWLADHKQEEVRALWAHFVFRVLAVFDTIPIFVPARYKNRAVTQKKRFVYPGTVYQ
ncbi:hypothetical protein EV121DRAFT_284782 [Schizophyllum commune]